MARPTTTHFQYAFLDSGTGGLPYLHQLRIQAPSSSCVYIADTKNFPYGEKTREQVIHYATEVVEKIITQFTPELIVIACNTISVSALEALRKKFPIPFVGTVPAIKLASKISKNRTIGLLATERTVNDPYTDSLIEQFAPDTQVHRIGDSVLISRIEHDLLTASKQERLDAVRTSVQALKDKGVDTIILACTHFLHVIDEIKELAGASIQIIDSREGVVQQALRLVSPKPESFATACYITGGIPNREQERFQNYASLFDIEWGGIL